MRLTRRERRRTMQPQANVNALPGQPGGQVQFQFINVADLLYVSPLFTIDRAGYDDTREDPNREVIVTVNTGGEPYERAFVGEQADRVWYWFLRFTGQAKVEVPK